MLSSMNCCALHVDVEVFKNLTNNNACIFKFRRILTFGDKAISEFQKLTVSKNLSCKNVFYLHKNKKSFSYQ